MARRQPIDILLRLPELPLSRVVSLAFPECRRALEVCKAMRVHASRCIRRCVLTLPDDEDDEDDGMPTTSGGRHGGRGSTWFGRWPRFADRLEQLEVRARRILDPPVELRFVDRFFQGRWDDRARVGHPTDRLALVARLVIGDGILFGHRDVDAVADGCPLLRELQLGDGRLFSGMMLADDRVLRPLSRLPGLEVLRIGFQETFDAPHHLAVLDDLACLNGLDALDVHLTMVGTERDEDEVWEFDDASGELCLRVGRAVADAAPRLRSLVISLPFGLPEFADAFRQATRLTRIEKLGPHEPDRSWFDPVLACPALVELAFPFTQLQGVTELEELLLDAPATLRILTLFDSYTWADEQRFILSRPAPSALPAGFRPKTLVVKSVERFQFLHLLVDEGIIDRIVLDVQDIRLSYGISNRERRMLVDITTPDCPRKLAELFKRVELKDPRKLLPGGATVTVVGDDDDLVDPPHLLELLGALLRLFVDVDIHRNGAGPRDLAV